MKVSRLLQGNVLLPDTKAELSDSILHYWTLKDELYLLEGVPMKGHKILIMRPLQAEVLKCLHATHQGVNGMSANACQQLFWPGLDAHTRQTRAQSRSCNRISPSQPKEPLAEPSLPELPFQHNVVDLCDIRGHLYLIFADRYTGWVEAALMPDANAKKFAANCVLGFAPTAHPRNNPQMVDHPFKVRNISNF